MIEGCNIASSHARSLPVLFLILLACCSGITTAEEGYTLNHCSLNIASTPAGATVAINGANVGTTPVTGIILMADTPSIIFLAYPGYKDYTASVTLSNGETRSVSYTLERKTVDLVAEPVRAAGGTTTAPVQAVPVVIAGGTTPVPVQYQIPVQKGVTSVTPTPVVLQRVDVQKPAGTPGIPSGTITPAATLTPPAPEETPVPVTLTGENYLPLLNEAAGSQQDNLPLSHVIPDRLALIAAMITGAAVALLTAFIESPEGARVRRTLEKTTAFVQNLVPGEMIGLLSVTEAKRRGIVPSTGPEKPPYLLTSREWLVVVVAALGFALAFLIQNRLSIDIERFIIFLSMGACVVILHDVGHRVTANRTGRTAEVQFWGLGFITMIATAWFFGNAFAKPSRTIVGSGPGADARSAAVVQAAGPVINFIAAALSLLLIPFGGFFAVVGSAGFAMNLLSCVYSLLPITPMEGKSIWDWNRYVWAIFCLPLILGYAAIYLVR